MLSAQHSGAATRDVRSSHKRNQADFVLLHFQLTTDGLSNRASSWLLPVPGTRITGGRAAAIAEALRGNEVLTNLVLYNNNVGDKGAAALASALRVNGVLTTLNLHLNNLGDEGKGVIRDAVSGRVGFELII